jgi:hypothetical protein
MDLLRRRISGDWYDVRSVPLQFFAVQDYLQLETTALSSIAAELRSGRYDNLAALKRDRLAPLFFAIEEGRYQALATAQIAALASIAREVVFLVMMQRVVVASTKQTDKQIDKTTDAAPAAPDAPSAVADIDIGDIIRDVAERVAADADLQQQAPIKAILVKTKEYRRERDKLAELTAKAGEEQQQRLATSFKQTFEDIFATIRKNYAQVVGADVDRRQPDAELPILQRADVSLLAAVLTRQAEAFSRVYSTVAFAAAERYKTLELLSGLAQDRAVVDELVDEELITAVRAAQTRQGGGDVLRALAAAVAAGIERHLLGPVPEPEPPVE